MYKIWVAALAVMLLSSSHAWGQDTLPLPDPVKGDVPADLPSQVAGKKKSAKSAIAKQKGWLGVGLVMSSEDEARELGYAQPVIKVDQVFAGSPAESSGFEIGDYIVEFQGDSVYEISQLVALVGGTKPGSKVAFKRVRGATKDTALTEDVPLLLGVRPDSYQLLVDHYVGQPAPELQAFDQSTSKALTLAAHEGSVVMVDFWATWCGPCRAAMPHLSKLHEKRKADGLVIIGVSDEEENVIGAFLKDNPLPYLIARDDERGTNRDYMINAYPTLFLVDRKGVVRHVFIGASDLDAVDVAVDQLLAE